MRVSVCTALWTIDVDPGRDGSHPRCSSSQHLRPPLPDRVLAQGARGDQDNRRGAVMGLLGDLPQTRTNLLVVVMNDAVYTSRPPPVPWSSFGCDSLAHLLFIIAKRSFGLLLPWAYRLWNRRESWLETEARLTRDLGDMLKWDTIRIQMLPENHTLVTFQTQDPALLSRDNTFKLNNLPRWWCRHSPAAHAALLANLDRGPSLKHLKVKIRCSVTFTDLFAVMDRHESIRYLSCSPFSLTPVWSKGVPR
ncbi:hypothetical protein FB45DRAFT_1078990 [Roridomyces roridus]|uniref:Uncharacterized protein n=1 Tax=Roridomyces roridus TaxID=1738132 RepID=A0AAD7G3B9_9AGAR|nr:hypothetical protein FB45DRAFT_1078990 [Roridomyces roridus]